jgi:hypothetical protein
MSLLLNLVYTAHTIYKRPFTYKHESLLLKICRYLLIVGHWTRVNKSKGHITSTSTNPQSFYLINPLTWLVLLVGIIVYFYHYFFTFSKY